MHERITAEFLWTYHRAALGGRSSVTGAELPLDLSGCPPGAQAAHWGMALAVAQTLNLPEPEAPPAVTPEEQQRVRLALGIG